MGKEIEKKFLVSHDGWRKQVSQSFTLRQGYLSTDPERTVRIRTRGNTGVLTIKGKTIGISRPEFEYIIPLADALDMLQLCTGAVIEKERHLVTIDELSWEVDVFAGDNLGLVLAEVELRHENQHVNLPSWIGREVSHNKHYFNASLAKYPFCDWSEQEKRN